MRRFFVAFCAVMALSILAGCTGGEKAAPAAGAAVKEYPLKGEVVSLSRDTQSANIKHEKIDGWMEAMTMEFPVKDKAEFDSLRAGDHITATVFVQDTNYWIGRIRREAAEKK